jgi:hypothetical protein
LPLIGVALAAALELVLRLTPSYDPYGWLVWGRQTLHWALDPQGAPSWKPLTWLLATPLALAGGAAPTLWLVVSCAGGLAALWLAYRLAARLGGALAGAVAVVALLLCRDWVTHMLTGSSEPFAAALALGAVDRHIAGQRRLALGLLVLAALLRPECGLALAAYLVWLWREEPGARALEVGLVALLPVLWFLPPYLAVGTWFNANDPVFHADVGTRNPLTVIERGGKIVIWPVAIAAGVGLVIALRRGGRHRRLAIALVAAAVTWAAGTVVMAAAGFPGIQRFMLPAAAMACVLAGAGFAWAGARIAQWVRTGRWPLAAGASLLVGALVVWYASFRVSDAVRSVEREQARAQVVRSLRQAVDRAGGSRRLLACGSPTAEVGYQSTLAWDLRMVVGAVGYRPQRDVRRHPHVVLFTTDSRAAAGPHRRLLARAGPWRVVGIRTRARCPIAGAVA